MLDVVSEMIFKAQLLEGRGFGQENQALLCCATFAGVSKTTQYSSAADQHAWNSTLKWSITREDLKSATSNTNHCKISVLRRDGKCLGWVVLSLRAAKLQRQYRSNADGLWLQLNATKLAQPPELRIVYSLEEDHPLSSAQQRNSPLIMRPSGSCSSQASETSSVSAEVEDTLGLQLAEVGSAAGSSSSSSQKLTTSGRRNQRGPRSQSASLRGVHSGGTSQGLSAEPSSHGAVATSDTAQHATESTHSSAAVRRFGSNRDDPGQQDQESPRQPVVPQGHHLKSSEVVRGDAEDSSTTLEASEVEGAGQVPDTTSADPSAAGQCALDTVTPAAAETAAEKHTLDASGPHVDAAGGATTMGWQPELEQQLMRPDAAKDVQQQELGSAVALTDTHTHTQAAVDGSFRTPAAASSSAASDALAAIEAQLPSFSHRQHQQQWRLFQQQDKPAQALQQPGVAQQGEHQQLPLDSILEVPAQQQQHQEIRGVAAVQSQEQVPEVQPAGVSGSTHPTEDPMTEAAAHTAQQLQAARTYTTTAEPGSEAASRAVTAVQHTDDAQAAAPAGISGPVPEPQRCALVAQQAAVGPVPDPMRDFVLTLDMRSFQAGRRLPVALGSIYVTAWMPKELTGFLMNQCDAKLPPRFTPLKTKPVVAIPRGSEGALPNGTASVSFASGVMALAGLLVAEPRVVLEVWHKERLRSDLLLGVASLPLSALLQECWVDGYAPVYALMTKASTAAGSSIQQQQARFGDEEKVQVGLLRVVMSLEDRGPATAQTAKGGGAAVTAESDLTRTTSSDQLLQPVDAYTSSAPARDCLQAHQGQTDAQQQRGGAAAAAVASSAGRGPDGFRHLPEYLVAWELEVWKKAEEARFRAQLQELEQQRMGVIEAAWRSQEAQRQSEAASMKAKYARLEQQTKELLATTQERERALLAAEAEFRLRKAGLEREAAARMTEAEAAVRRLQVECEHQLGIEREKTTAAMKQRDAADARTTALEVQFAEYVAAHRKAPESQLKAELVATQAAVKAVEARLQAALKLKQQYKQQVRQLTRSLAALHHKQQQDALHHQQQQLAEALARERNNLAVTRKAELATLKKELGQLRSAAAAADAAFFRSSGAGFRSDSATQSCSDDNSSLHLDGRHVRSRKPRHVHRKDKENRVVQAQVHPEQKLSPPLRPKANDTKTQVLSLQLQQQQCHLSFPCEVGENPAVLCHSDAYGSDGECSSNSGSSTDLLRAAAERSARDTAAEVASLAAILNPVRHDAHPQGLSAASRGSGTAGDSGQPLDPSSSTPGTPGTAVNVSLLPQPGAVQPGGAASCVAAADGSGCLQPMVEVRRLLREKAELLSSGLYGLEDAVIKQVDARVQALAELASCT